MYVKIPQFLIPNPQDPYHDASQISKEFCDPYLGSSVTVKVESRSGWNTFNEMVAKETAQYKISEYVNRMNHARAERIYIILHYLGYVPASTGFSLITYL